MDKGDHKGTNDDLNPAPSIAFLRRLLHHLIDVAERELVHPPAAELARWRDVLGHLAPIPVGTTRFNTSLQPNMKVLLPQELPIFTYPLETRDEPEQFYGVFPGEQIGLGSAKALLSTARNTMLLSGFTQPPPRMPTLGQQQMYIIFPAYVRVGCSRNCTLNATWILSLMSSVIEVIMPPNGFSTMEQAGGAVALNDMLLMSFETFLRFFPVWPRGENASFANLRAVGAFLVSASLKNGVVEGVTVGSEAGRNCTFLSPWEPSTAAPSVTSLHGIVRLARVELPSGDTSTLWRFPTVPGGVYKISPGANAAVPKTNDDDSQQA